MVPATIKVNYYGKSESVQAKDLILVLMKELGVEGATYNAIEFTGNVIDELSVEERMTMCNMVVECGAKTALWCQTRPRWITRRPEPPSRIPW